MQHSKARNGLVVLDRWADAIPLAVGGLPSPESIFTVHCVVEILRRTRGEVRTMPLNTGEDSERIAKAVPGKTVLPFFDTPDTWAREAMLAMQVPIVVVTGNFAETARFCMVARDLDMLQAARFVSQSFSCLESLDRCDNVLWVALDTAASLTTWIDEVASWLRLQPSMWQSARQQMLAEYAAWPTVERAIHALVQFADPGSPGWEHLPDASETIFDTLGTSYHFGPIDTVFWPAQSILEPGDPALPVTDPIQLTGPARMLTFGPFLHLPLGRWIARYQFEADGHPVGNLMEFDVVNGDNVLVSGRAQVGDAGKFGFDCEFEMDEARLPVENRVTLAEGSIGGLFKPLGIRLNRNG